jgi:aspartyl-tRNA(Asn)/glutamyl-tRNA(Gln) amidotransferase subunit C
MKISKEDVEHVAQLARLRFQEDELERFTFQMDAILNFVEQLNHIDTSQIEPTTHAMDLSNVFREDEIAQSLDIDEALANAPNRVVDSFQVPRIIE